MTIDDRLHEISVRVGDLQREGADMIRERDALRDALEAYQRCWTGPGDIDAVALRFAYAQACKALEQSCG